MFSQGKYPVPSFDIQGVVMPERLFDIAIIASAVITSMLVSDIVCSLKEVLRQSATAAYEFSIGQK